MAISAIFSLIRPKSPICLPKALRSLEYLEAVIRTCLEPPDARRAESETAGIENVEGNDVAAADFVQHVFLRHQAIFEEHRSRGTAVNAHLVFFIAGLAAGETAFNDEGGQFSPSTFANTM